MNNLGRFWNQDDENKLYIDRFEEIQKIIEERERVLSKQKYESYWGFIYVSLGLLATISSAISAVFTLSSNQKIVLLLSILSSTSAAILTFLNPSNRSDKWRSIKSDCSILKLEVGEAKIVIYSSKISSEEKIRKLRELNQKLIIFEKKLGEILS
jgi:hypothetical protein